MAKYDPLVERLNETADASVSLSFDQIDGLVGGLPESAYTTDAWWANDSVGHVQSKAWLAAGWRTTNLDVEARRVTFTRTGTEPAAARRVVDGTRRTFGADTEFELIAADEYRYNARSGLHHVPSCPHGTQTYESLTRDEALARWRSTPDVPSEERQEMGWCETCCARQVRDTEDAAGVRRELLVRVMFDILQEQEGPISYQDFLAEVRKRADLNDYELSRNESNQQRFDTFLGFASGHASRIGWINKTRQGWILTDLGRAGLEEIGDGEVARELSRRYRVVHKAEARAKSPSGRRAWLVRGSTVKGKDLVPGWLEQGTVTLSAKNLRDVTPEISRDDLRAIVAQDYSHASYAAQAEKVDEFHNFLSRMEDGQLIITTDGDRVFAGDIAGEAAYVDDGEPRIEREVEWRERSLRRGDLPSDLRNRLGVQRDVLDLTQHIEILDRLFTEDAAPAEVVEETQLVLADAPADLAASLHVDRAWLQECIELLRDRPQLIFYGPPGTGKTYIAQALAEHLAGEHVRLVQFHPSYSYEDFFEGFRPTARGGFELTPGPMRRIVDQALADAAQPHVLIIDEINRGNLAKVFGELYFLLEYRDRSVELLYGDGDFSLPHNVFIIGTMNTADRSIALVDAAMRRRFAFVPLHPTEPPARDVLRSWLRESGRPERAADLLEELNRQIADPDFKIGPSYFMRDKAFEDGGLERMWRTSILPLLEEHHYGEMSRDEVAARYGYAAIAAKVDQVPLEDDDASPGTG